MEVFLLLYPPWKHGRKLRGNEYKLQSTRTAIYLQITSSVADSAKNKIALAEVN
jgi:hypothetical protein